MYGALPREAVCTENLTPWLKMRPCGDSDGLAALLHRPQIYAAEYHSMRTHFCREGGVLALTQSLTLVLQGPEQLGSLSASPCRLVGALWEAPIARSSAKHGIPSCPLAASSSVYLLEGNSVKRAAVGGPGCHWDEDQSVLPAALVPEPVHLEAHQHLTGKGDEHGSIVTEVELGDRPAPRWPRAKVVCVGQVVPWYLRLHLHTLRLVVDGEDVDWRSASVQRRLVPSRDRARPSTLELCLALPGTSRRFYLDVSFEKVRDVGVSGIGNKPCQ